MDFPSYGSFHIGFHGCSTSAKAYHFFYNAAYILRSNICLKYGTMRDATMFVTILIVFIFDFHIKIYIFPIQIRQEISIQLLSSNSFQSNFRFSFFPLVKFIALDYGFIKDQLVTIRIQFETSLKSHSMRSTKVSSTEISNNILWIECACQMYYDGSSGELHGFHMAHMRIDMEQSDYWYPWK